MGNEGIIIALYVLSICSAKVVQDPIDPIIETDKGYVKGKTLFSQSGRRFDAFRGIPYAKPPINGLRFKAPVEADSWNTVLNAQNDAEHCIQKNYLFKNPVVEGSENCLYLNVYTPQIKTTKRSITNSSSLPVMVFIHWGGFFTGYSSSEYLGPEYFMDKDIVLVTFNYRLGVLGFLSTNNDVAPGNYGLKDQLLALKWIKNNIHRFGGDSSSITLFGQSAGAASVNFHMFNPESKTLFHRAISESGTALSLWAQPQSFLQPMMAEAQGIFVNCTDKTPKVLVECLRKVDATTLVDSADKFKIFSVDPLNVFMPSIEKKTDNNPNPFLTKASTQYIRDKDFANIPWIIGIVGNEGLIRAEPIIRQSATRTKLNLNFDTLMPDLLALKMSVPLDDVPNLWKEMQEFYFQGKLAIDDNDKSTLKGLIDVYTDRSFVYSTYQAAMFHHIQGHKKIWFYKFNYTGEYSYGNEFAATDANLPNFDWGVSHCDELLYLFKTPALFKSLKSHNDQLMRDNMIGLWTNFAIHGDPTPQGPGQKFDKWLKVDDSDNSDSKKLHYLNIDGSYKNEYPPTMKMEYGIYNNRLKFWEDYPLYENIPELGEKVPSMGRKQRSK